MTDLVRPRSHTDVLARFQDAALAKIQTGEYQPFVWPYRALGPYLVILYLLLPPTRSRMVYALRYPLLLFCAYHAVDGIIWCRSPSVTVGYGIGLLNAWSLLWCCTLLLFKDARSELKRIEGPVDWSEVSSTGEVAEPERDATSSVIVQGQKSSESGLRSRSQGRAANGHVNNYVTANATAFRGNQRSSHYHYQTLPAEIFHRLDWVIDLVCSFRGPRWAHRITGLAPPPAAIQSSLSKHADVSLKPPTRFSHITRRQLLFRNAPEMLICYVTLDILKTITLSDPYFWSLGPSASYPSSYSALTRLLISLAFTYTALQSIFLLAPLIFACLLGPQRIGAHAWPWLYSPYFGSPRALSKHDLAGAWGMWWQQLFRFGFQEAAEASAKVLGGEQGGWGKRSQRGKILRMTVAFGLSGVLHACASYTAMGRTWPWTGSALFFWLQPLGLLAQKYAITQLQRRGWLDQIPWWFREGSNALFVVIWFALTGPLIADEFTRTGVWLYEPVPFSLIRGWQGEGWWRWGGTWVRIHRANEWYLSGLAF